MALSTLPIFSSPFVFPLKTPKPFKPLTIICSSQEPRKPTKNPPRPISRNRKRTPYGTSRRSILMKTFTQEQVKFTASVSDDPHVGIIGGGMAGLVCALNLEKRGVKSTVFDTGMHGLGGRMGTRVIDPQQLIFDHAAQFFTMSDSRFAELVDYWLEKGLVRQWRGLVGLLELGGQFVPLPSSPPRFIGVKGMRPLADSLLSETSMVNVVRPCWISKLEPFNGMWHLSENGRPCGQFDAIVIAHNGKCANRLLASSGLPLIARQMKRLELSSIWALLAAFEDPLPIGDGKLTFEGAFVKGVDSVSWMANNSMKLLGSQGNGPHCWTFFSTAAYGKRNKVPQENIPTATAEKVKTSMLKGIEAALGLPKESLQRPFYARVQLWGAALPTNTPAIPCIFDPHGRAGICGDWLLGSNLESAALSGMALANHMADYLQSDGACTEEFAVGLEKEFQAIQGHDIGQFPGTSMVNVVRPCWISKLEPFNGMWHLSENGRPCGQFDAIVIAHNGKCANRLLASSGLPLIARQMKRLELSSIWALLAAFEDPLPIGDGKLTFEGAFVKGVDSVSWMANNSMKLLGSQGNGPHCWTFFSTAAYGKRNKVPQENIPTATAEKVKTSMLKGIEAALGLPKESLQRPFYARVQLWGAALPTNTPAIPCIFDPHGRAGICGDWLLGSNLESAALSGMALANHMADYLQSDGACTEEFAVGLEKEFQAIQGHDIGQFPGVVAESLRQDNEMPAYQLAT